MIYFRAIAIRAGLEKKLFEKVMKKYLKTISFFFLAKFEVALLGDTPQIHLTL